MIKKRTMDDYKTAGAYMRLLKHVMQYAHTACSAVLYAKQSDRFYSAEKTIGALCSCAEDNMFMDFPNLESHEGFDVFWGALDINPPRTETDKEVVELAIKLVKEAFGDNWK